MVTVQLLGGACLRSGDTLIGGPPAQRHRIALLTLIVASFPQPLSRDRAMALLWPERDLSSARRLLNLAVHVLRSALGDATIVSTGDGLLLNPSHLSCDLHELRAAIGLHDPDRIVRAYTGPLLDGFHLAESAEFGYWLDERRHELAHAHVQALLQIAERQEQSGDLHGLVGTCRRLVAADPASAAHALALMRALDAAGERAGATQHAADHRRRLRADYDLDPDPAVTAFAEQLRAAPVRRKTMPARLARPPAPAVAVLPFSNLSGGPEYDYFADGITEDVIAHLSKIRALSVISRGSVMPFKQRQQSTKEIGQALGATAVVEGSVRFAGDRVRIVATFVDTQTNRHLWAETYDRRMVDIFAIQTEVALHIAAALEAELSATERTRVEREPTKDVLAYHQFLQGRRRISEYTLNGLMQSIEHFEGAIARDPTFALAYANLAMAYTQLAADGLIAPDLAYERATAAVAQALRLDPELSEAHCTIGNLRAVREFDWPGAEQAFQRALELSPSNADAYDLYGRFCAGLERYDESIALLQRAQALDPLTHRVDLATTLLRAGRYDEALQHAANALELDLHHDRTIATLGWAHFLSGRQEEGLAQLERAVSASRGNTIWLAQLGEAYALAGHAAKAHEILKELEERARHDFVSSYHFAYVYTGLGESERALDWLERAVAERTGPAYGIKGSFLFKPLREHPRFRALLRQMKLA